MKAPRLLKSEALVDTGLTLLQVNLSKGGGGRPENQSHKTSSAESCSYLQFPRSNLCCSDTLGEGRGKGLTIGNWTKLYYR